MKKILFIIIMLMIFSAGIAKAAEYAPGYEVIVDNSDIGNGFSCTGGFKLCEAADAYGGTARCVTAETENSQKARWTPKLPVNGYYRIYITFPKLSTPAATANVQIEYGSASKYYARNINPAYNTGEWIYIGTYYMEKGGGGNVALKPNSDGAVGADAVRFVLSCETTETALAADVPETVAYNENEAVLVQSRATGDNYLSVKGEPYYIKGVCKDGALEKIVAAGGNTIRTYSAMIAKDTTKTILDKAHSLGMKVVLGLDLPKETDSFTYKDNYDIFLSVHFENFKKQIQEFKNHPALLMWAVGNEIDVIGCSAEVYGAINEVAAYIKAQDPYHPITSVHAGASAGKISSIMKYASNVDVVSVNVYSGIASAHKNIMTVAGWQGAYMITEYAVNQPFEVLNGDDAGSVFGNVVIEKPDYLKAEQYYDRYMNYIFARRSSCLGSFAFATHGTYRGTHTWYNVFLEEDYKCTPVYDALYYAWNGKKRDNTAPIIKNIKINHRETSEEVGVEAGGTAVITVETNDADADELTFLYEIRSNNMDSLMECVSGVSFTPEKGNPTTVTASGLPKETGIYRLYVYAYDGQGNIGYGNIPFKIIEQRNKSVLAKESFSGITGLGEDYTLPKENGFADVWRTSADFDTASKMKVDVLGRYSLVASTPNQPTKNIYNRLCLPIDMDTETDYYVSWIQGFTSLEAEKYIKVGFVNETNAQEISVVFNRKSKMPQIGIKIGNEIIYFDETVSSGSLYNVFCRIQARAEEEDIISVKIWPVNYSQPCDWTYVVKKDIKGKFSVISMQANNSNGSRAYFGEFLLEGFAGYEKERVLSREAEIKAYLENAAGIPITVENCEMGTYKLIEDLMELRKGAYIKKAVLCCGGEEESAVPDAEQEKMQLIITLQNDYGVQNGCQGDIYCAFYDEERLTLLRTIGSENVYEALSETEIKLDVPLGTEKIKIFLWDGVLFPKTSVTEINRAGTVNY